jgi:hemerythrin superfamily protein
MMKSKPAKATKSPSKNLGEKETGIDAIEMLKTDHKQVKALFKEFEEIHQDEENDGRKSEIVKQICAALTIHAQIEEEIFYPAVRDVIDDDDLMDEAEVEHAEAKALITQLEAMDTEDDYYDAKVTVLGEQVDHHITEEEKEMFPQIQKAKMDTLTLGRIMLKRKEELEDELGIFEGGNPGYPPIKKNSSKPLHR